MLFPICLSCQVTSPCFHLQANSDSNVGSELPSELEARNGDAEALVLLPPLQAVHTPLDPASHGIPVSPGRLAGRFTVSKVVSLWNTPGSKQKQPRFTNNELFKAQLMQTARSGTQCPSRAPHRPGGRAGFGLCSVCGPGSSPVAALLPFQRMAPLRAGLRPVFIMFSG